MDGLNIFNNGGGANFGEGDDFIEGYAGDTTRRPVPQDSGAGSSLDTQLGKIITSLPPVIALPPPVKELPPVILPNLGGDIVAQAKAFASANPIMVLAVVGIGAFLVLKK